jgi:transposase
LRPLDQRIAEKLEPYGAQHLLLMQIPGVDWLVAAVLIAEIGIDMSVFLSASHLAAWAGVCPGNHESAGKQRSGRARKGNIHLRTILALAIAHKILVAAYHMLAKGIAYQDLGETYLDQIRQTRTVANLKRRIERLGYQVTLEPKAQAA